MWINHFKQKFGQAFFFGEGNSCFIYFVKSETKYFAILCRKQFFSNTLNKYG